MRQGIPVVEHVFPDKAAEPAWARATGEHHGLLNQVAPEDPDRVAIGFAIVIRVVTAIE